MPRSKKPKAKPVKSPKERKNKKAVTPENPTAAGRPTLYGPELVDQLCELIEEGLSRARAALYLGINENTITNWTKDYPEFLDRLTRAEVECELFHLRRLNNAMTGPGQEDFRSSAWLLARKWPDQYSEKVKQELSGSVDVIKVYNGIDADIVTGKKKPDEQ